MYSKKLVLLISVVTLISTFISCDKQINQPSGNEDNPLQESETMVTLPPGITNSDILGRIYITKDIYRPLNTYVTQETFSADFWNRGRSWNVDAGTVTLNGSNIIAKHSAYVNDAGEDSAYTYIEDLPVVIDGRNYNVSISGSNHFPASNIEISSPAAEIELTNISNGMSINKSQDLTINWTCTSDTSTKIAIIFTPVEGGFSKISKYIQDTGSLTIPSSELSGIPSGEYRINALCYDYNLVEVASGDYLLGLVIFKKRYYVTIN